MGLKPEELKERSLLTRDIPTFGPRVAGDSEPMYLSAMQAKTGNSY